MLPLFIPFFFVNICHFSNSIFSGNNAKEAKSAYILGFEEDSIYFDNGNFDVYGYQSSMVSKYWFKSSGNNMTFANGEGQLPGNEEGNIYVSKENGNNECNGDESCPVLSIDKALSLAIPNLLKPYDIIVDKAIYSTNISGEQFPLQTIDYIDLIAPDGAFINNDGDAEDELIFLTDAVEVEIINFEYFNQSMLQAYYAFGTVTMNEYVFQDNNSLVLAYRCLDSEYDGSKECANLGPCVGSRVWDTSGYCSDTMWEDLESCENASEEWTWNYCGSGVCDVPVMGADGYEFTEGYCEQTQTITMQIENDEISSEMHIIGNQEWSNNNISIVSISNFQLGDINFDDNINVTDIIMLIEHIISSSIIDNDHQLLLSDINSDGNINVSDIVFIVDLIIE